MIIHKILIAGSHNCESLLYLIEKQIKIFFRTLQAFYQFFYFQVSDLPNKIIHTSMYGYRN